MGPFPKQVASGQREALETVRRVMANLPPVSGENPLGLLLDGEGRAPSINVEEILGKERQARLEQGNQFCRYLDRRAEWVAAFDRMPHFHQILVVLLAENIEQHPQVVRDRFLSANSEYRILAISRSAHSKTIASTVTKEAELGHLATFFRGR